MSLYFYTAIILALASLWIIRLLWILSSFRHRKRKSAKLLIVLGSGGHTAEMLRLLESLDFKQFPSRVYLISSGDALSEAKARAFEAKKLEENTGNRTLVLHTMIYQVLI
jgi:Oligosaccharide biosynthesis protein Alg14 like